LLQHSRLILEKLDMPTAPLSRLRKKALLIDDDPKLLFGLKALMTRKGYDALATTDGNEGIRLAKESHPDIIVCDVMMPPPNGFNLKRILASDPLTAAIPFIFLTARTVAADKIAGLEQGADDYVTKPFNTDELLLRIEAVLRRDEFGRQRGLHEMEDIIEKMRHSISTRLGHEFRTPLTVILANLEMALGEKFAGRMEDLDWYLESSLESAQRISALVEDLILLGDIDNNALGCQRIPIDIDSAFLRPLREVLRRYEDKRLDVNLAIEDGVKLHASENEFSRAAVHLVDNACKFSPEKAKVWISLNWNGTGGCSLVVENEGSFIPLEFREKVFERYYQMEEGDTRAHPGLGIGLTIARAIAEACGGSVAILDSEFGCKARMIYPPLGKQAFIG
jgi:signal transduction histidine kinase